LFISSLLGEIGVAVVASLYSIVARGEGVLIPPPLPLCYSSSVSVVPTTSYVAERVVVDGSRDWFSVSQTLVWAKVVAEIHDAARISVRVNDDRHEFAVIVE